jgi:hypothetical protein
MPHGGQSEAEGEGSSGLGTTRAQQHDGLHAAPDQNTDHANDCNDTELGSTGQGESEAARRERCSAAVRQLLGDGCQVKDAATTGNANLTEKAWHTCLRNVAYGGRGARCREAEQILIELCKAVKGRVKDNVAATRKKLLRLRRISRPSGKKTADAAIGSLWGIKDQQKGRIRGLVNIRRIQCQSIAREVDKAIIRRLKQSYEEAKQVPQGPEQDAAYEGILMRTTKAIDLDMVTSGIKARIDKKSSDIDKLRQLLDVACTEGEQSIQDRMEVWVKDISASWRPRERDAKGRSPAMSAWMSNRKSMRDTRRKRMKRKGRNRVE